MPSSRLYWTVAALLVLSCGGTRGGPAGSPQAVHRSTDATEDGTEGFHLNRTPAPVYWAAEQGYTGTFGWSLSYDGSTLICGAPTRRNDQVAGAYLFAPVRGHEEVVGMRLIGRAETRLPSTNLGLCVAVCSNSALVGIHPNGVLALGKHAGKWRIEGVLGSFGDWQLSGCPLSCRDGLAVGAARARSKNAALVYGREQGRWVPRKAVKLDHGAVVQAIHVQQKWLAVGTTSRLAVYEHAGVSVDRDQILPITGEVYDVAGDGDWLAVALKSPAWTGTVRLFRHRPGHGWAAERDLAFDGVTPVALWGSFLAVGMPWENSSAPEAGQVRVYHLDNDAWRIVAVVESPDRMGGRHFGESVALRNDELVVGAPGSGDGMAGTVFFIDLLEERLDQHNVDTGEPRVVRPRASIEPVFYRHGAYVDPHSAPPPD